MREKLTTEFVRRPPLKNVDVYDTKYPGLVLRCRASGVHTYRVNYGRGKWVTLGRIDTLTPDEARAKARDELSRIDKGHDPKAARHAVKGNLTFGQYLEDHYAPWLLAQRPRTRQIVRLKGEAFADLRATKLADLTGFQVERWRSARLKADTTAGTCNRDVGALMSALRRAVKWNLLSRNPLSDVALLQEDASGVVRYLSLAEEKRLRAALAARDARREAKRAAANQWRLERGYRAWPALTPDHLTPIVLVALNTGLRRGELFNLRWFDVDLVGGQLTVLGEGAKSGQTRHVPLNMEARQTLVDWRTSGQRGTPNSRVFPGRADSEDGRLADVKKAWLPIVKAAKLTNFRFHDLRHSFASKLVMAGVDLNTVRELLGHSDIKMTLRYSHLSPSHKAAAVAKLVAHGA